ncbi:MAG: c-type cytochrome [Myxococcota bacterium]
MLLALSLIAPLLAADVAKGKTLYAPCVACHGQSGEGNAALNAPVIGGQEVWYLERQLKSFRSGARGGDPIGATMVPMAKALPDDAAVADVAAYVATLAPAPAKPALGGDATKGKALYAACAACHGQSGEGNAALNAPALWRQQDAYLVRQLVAFKSGKRGSDPFGAQMKPMAQTLVDEQAMKDVAAYIATLKR